jgi:UDP-GlcNAc:undecaprenyl-phosphate/decaprenyl-phosphate GlcNAc-1-phosphate transferase
MAPLTAILDALASNIAMLGMVDETTGKPTRLGVFEGYVGVLVISFVVTLFATPIMRRLAIFNGVIDRPSDPRKIHKIPVAYLGGVAVYLGIMAGVFFSLLAIKFTTLIDYHPTTHHGEVDDVRWPVPWSAFLGMTVIVLVGVIDDVKGISPRVKVGGQLFAAACLAIDMVGVRLAAGIVLPMAQALGIETSIYHGAETVLISIPLPTTLMGYSAINIDTIYWIGTAMLGLGVVGLCNAANLIDGLDGLCTGTTAITSVGLLLIALSLAVIDDGPRDSQRIILCMAILGACLGFLPHNFNPATIFLGDAGSLLLGYCMCVVIFSLGDTGKTHYVAAGLIAFMLPILDTALAIVRRKMEGKSISAADDQHIHHILKRALGVKKAVMVLYGIAFAFATLGALVAMGRARVVYLLALLLVSFIGVTAIKIARRKALEAQMLQREAMEKVGTLPTGDAASVPAQPAPPSNGVTQ